MTRVHFYAQPQYEVSPIGAQKNRSRERNRF